jgi:hypothetical protein
VDEVDTVSHYAPVLIAQNSSAPASVAGPNFFYKTRRRDPPKLAVILHRMWVDRTEFNWSKKEVAA